MTKTRLIINVNDGISMLEALDYVKEVVKMGKICNKNTQYCYVTEFKDKTMVYSDKNDKSDKLTISRRGNKNDQGNGESW